MNKKLLISLFFMFFFCVYTYANITSDSTHRQLKRHFISMSAGIVVPFGDYSKVSPIPNSVEGIGYANQGYNVNLKSAYFFIPNMGAAVNIGLSGNQVNYDAITKELTTSLQGSGYRFDGTVGSWLNGYFLGGFCFSVPSEYVTVDFKLLGGGLLTSAPPLDVRFYRHNPSDNIHFSSKRTQSLTLGYGVGVVLRLNISNRWAFNISSELLGGSPTINRTLIVKEQGLITNTIQSNNIYDIEVFNFGVGVAYQFVKKK